MWAYLYEIAIIWLFKTLVLMDKPAKKSLSYKFKALFQLSAHKKESLHQASNGKSL